MRFTWWPGTRASLRPWPKGAARTPPEAGRRAGPRHAGEGHATHPRPDPARRPGGTHEMFSDFEMHNIGVPQMAPKFGKDRTGRFTGNVPFRNKEGKFTEDGDQDFGLQDIVDDDANRYKFRTSPLRNAALQPTFFHNGAF